MILFTDKEVSLWWAVICSIVCFVEQVFLYSFLFSSFSSFSILPFAHLVFFGSKARISLHIFFENKIFKKFDIFWYFWKSMHCFRWLNNNLLRVRNLPFNVFVYANKQMKNLSLIIMSLRNHNWTNILVYTHILSYKCFHHFQIYNIISYF